MSVLTRGSVPKRVSRRRALAFMTVFLAAGSLFMVIPAARADVPGHGFGYVWASDAARTIGEEYTPTAPFNVNSTGTPNTVVHQATGQYLVSFPGFGPLGTAMVTAYGRQRLDDYCKIQHWLGFTGSVATKLSVLCFDRNGTPVDAQFTATYTDNEPGMARGAYLWNDRPSESVDIAYEPDLSFQYNPTGHRNWINRYATGRYLIGLTGLGPSQGPANVLVTAYGSSAVYCTVLRTNSDSFSLFANVDCFTPGGAFEDSQFVLTYIEGGDTLFTPTGSRPMAYADLNCRDLWPLRGRCVGVQARPRDGLRVNMVADGQWAVFLPGVNLAGGNVQVTTRNDDRTPRRRCKVGFWNATDGVNVFCRDNLGRAVTQAHFTVSFVA
jgi:hypothetical protein